MAGTYTNLLYHLIFSTKNREKFIHEPLKTELYKYIGGIIRGEGGVLIEIGGMPEHLHLTAKFKPSVSVSDMLQKIKGNSSKWVNERPDRRARCGWQDGYGASSVSESQLSKANDYIRQQEEHHRRKTFKEEFIEFLERHGVEYDERYIWD